jgi:hypothetical protein
MKMLFKNPILWWKFEGRYYHKDFYNGVKNLIKWLPIIWKDRSYDHSYIFKILEHKLTIQSEYIGNKGNHLSSKRDAEIMMVCVNLIKKIRDKYYDSEYYDYHQSTYWFEDLKNKPGFSTWHSNIESEEFSKYFEKYPLVYKRVLNGEGIFPFKDNDTAIENKMRIAMNIAHINHDRARKLLFKIMEENMERWWN